MAAALPETQRQATLESFNVLDSPPEAIFDELARMAASICGTPIALVSLVDGRRQWFKAEVGLGTRETPRDVAFCAHAILGTEPFIVPDTSADSRFRDNPLVTGGPQIRFYAGAPLIAADGAALGTLCVIDRVPRELAPDRLDALRLLSRHVMEQLELRKRVTELARTSVRRGVRIDELEASYRQQNYLIERQERQISNLADYDAVTALPNRRLFLTRLAQQQELARLENRTLTVFVLDLQRFSLLSEALGHGQLEELLKEVARRLTVAVGDRDDVAHVDADRFAFLTPGSYPAGTAPLLDVELTEAVLLANPESVIQTLQMLRQWGVQVAIDDFGTGYSSLRYLARLPLDVLKIDVSFIHAMGRSPSNLAIVSSVISLAHGLRLKTVAEGVELEDQSNLLRLLRCDEIQGYLFSRPLEKSSLERLLIENFNRLMLDHPLV